MENWYVYEDADALTLQLNGGTYGTSDTLRLKSVRDYANVGTLTTEAGTTNAPLEWVVWETIYDLLQRQAWRAGADGLASIAAQRQEAASEVRKKRYRYNTNESRPFLQYARPY